MATSSRLDAIRSVYGVSVARNLMKVEASANEPSCSIFRMEGFISNSNYIAKKITMVLFINSTFSLFNTCAEKILLSDITRIGTWSIKHHTCVV